MLDVPGMREAQIITPKPMARGPPSQRNLSEGAQKATAARPPNIAPVWRAALSSSGPPRGHHDCHHGADGQPGQVLGAHSARGVGLATENIVE